MSAYSPSPFSKNKKSSIAATILLDFWIAYMILNSANLALHESNMDLDNKEYPRVEPRSV